MSNTLKLVLTDRWFEEIKSGRKTHEYRKVSKFWLSRLRILPAQFYPYVCIDDITRIGNEYITGFNLVEFQKAYRKNPERMTFEINKITIIGGEYTDLKCVEDVLDIELGERVK